MQLLVIIMLAIGLSVDSFSVSLAAGGCSCSCKKILRRLLFATSLAIFQASFFAIGAWVGSEVISLIHKVDHWVAFALLAYIGGRMIYDGIKDNGSKNVYDPFKWSNIIVLSVGTSIDAVAVGLAFACSNTDLFLTTFVVLLTTFIFSLAGLIIGSFLCKKVKFPFEIIGGIVLIAIGVKVLYEHLLIS